MYISPKIDVPEICDFLFTDKESVKSKIEPEVQTLEIDGAKTLSISCRFYPVGSDAPTIIIFPSFKNPPGMCMPIVAGLVQNRFNVILASYNSRATEKGKPCLERTFSDAKIIFANLIDKLDSQGYNGSKIVMGQGLGTVISIDIATQYPDSIKGLFLESCIGNVITYLAAMGAPVDSLGLSDSDNFDVITEIEKIELPTLFFHGSRDPHTPVPLAEKLQVACGARTKQFFVIPAGGHERLHEAGGELYFKTLRQFIETITGANNWRQRRRSFKKTDHQ